MDLDVGGGGGGCCGTKCGCDVAVVFIGSEYFRCKSGCCCWPDADVIGGGLFTLFGL